LGVWEVCKHLNGGNPGTSGNAYRRSVNRMRFKYFGACLSPQTPDREAGMYWDNCGRHGNTIQTSSNTVNTYSNRIHRWRRRSFALSFSPVDTSIQIVETWMSFGRLNRSISPPSGKSGLRGQSGSKGTDKDLGGIAL
jgi:hypothetical protein